MLEDLFKKAQEQVTVQSTPATPQINNTVLNNSQNSLNSIFDQCEFSTIKNKNYITSEVSATNNILDNIHNLNNIITQRNQAEVEDNTKNGTYMGLHGMSEQEYDEYQAWMYANYGIEVENQSVGNFQSAAVSMERIIGTQWAEEMATSYDSVLDLVLDEKLNNAINEMFGEDSMPSWDRLYASRGTLLENYGIAIDCLDPQNEHSTYVVSLVDEEGNVIQDENGNLAQTIKNDKLMPDGLAQRNEIFNSAVLDMMGYDCMSALDLSAQEYEMIKEMAKMDNSELGSSSNYKGSDGHTLRNKNKEDLKAKNGVDTNGKIILTDASAWLNGEYTDEQTGETTGRKKYWSDFYKKRDSGYYSTRINSVTGQSVNWVNKTITRNMYANYEETGEFSNGKVNAKGGSGYKAISSNEYSEYFSSELSSSMDLNSIEYSKNENEKEKIKITKEMFDNKLQELIESKNITESQAKEILLETYEIKYV